jgi:hypothetical protein
LRAPDVALAGTDLVVERDVPALEEVAPSPVPFEIVGCLSSVAAVFARKLMAPNGVPSSSTRRNRMSVSVAFRLRCHTTPKNVFPSAP